MGHKSEKLRDSNNITYRITHDVITNVQFSGAILLFYSMSAVTRHLKIPTVSLCMFIQTHTQPHVCVCVCVLLTLNTKLS